MKKIFLLATALLGAGQLFAQQPATMIMRTNNGAVVKTDVSEVEKITFSDAEFNLNSSGIRLLDANELTWPEDRLLPCLLPPASTVKTLDMPAAGLNDHERVMFCTLQGIVNRSQPRILLYNHKEEAITIWPTAHSLRTSPVNASTPYEMVKLYKEEVKGLVLYSTEKSEHYANLAMTIAGLKNALPVTAEVRNKLIANGMDFPVIEDISSLTMTTALDVYNYLYDNYWESCNHRLLISERPLIPYVHDIGVAAGSACIYLDPRTGREKVMLDKFLKQMTPGRDLVLGWYPEERSGMGEPTRYGLTTVPADFFENTTVYTAVNKAVKIYPVPKRPKLENKVYAAVYISDGDNIQYCQHAMAKIYEQSGRGKLPLNWTISPALVDFSPSMLNYYYRKATTNDCFVSGPSGLGYIMPYNGLSGVYYANKDDAELLVPYAQLTNRYVENAGLRAITVWDNLSAVQRKSFAENIPYIYGLTINHNAGSLSTAIESNRLPIVLQTPWYTGSIDDLANNFNNVIKNFRGTKPLFVCGQADVWHAGPDALTALPAKLDALSPGNVQLCRADHWFSYYSEANHLPFNLTMLEDMEITSSPTKNKAQYAADGTPSQGYIWQSKTAGEDAWVQMDFKEPFSVSRYVIRHAEAGGLDAELNSQNFNIEVSLDGETWTTVGTHSGNTAAVNDVSITPVEARYVRVNVTKGGNDGSVRIGDIEVYGAH